MKKYLLILNLLIFLCSCSITQRKYLPGYNVEWTDRNAPEVVKKSEPPISKIAHNTTTPIKFSRHVSSVPSEIRNTINLKNNYYKKTQTISSSNHIEHNQVVLQDTTLHKQPSIFNPKAKKGLTYGILAFIIPIGVYLLLLVAGASGLYLVVGILFLAGLAAVVFAILALIYSIQAKKEIKENPTKYNNIKQARTGFILSIVFFSIILIYAILAAVIVSV